MAFKTILSKKVAAIALAGTIGLGAVGGATYAAAPGLMDKIVNTFLSYTSGDLANYKYEQSKTIPGRVSEAVSQARASFNGFYNTKLEAAKKKIDSDTNAYIKEKGTVSDEERKSTEEKIDANINKKTAEVTEQLKKEVDAEFAK